MSTIRRFHCTQKCLESHDRGFSWRSSWVCIHLNGPLPEKMSDVFDFRKNTYNLGNLYLFECQNPRPKRLSLDYIS